MIDLAGEQDYWVTTVRPSIQEAVASEIVSTRAAAIARAKEICAPLHLVHVECAFEQMVFDAEGALVCYQLDSNEYVRDMHAEQARLQQRLPPRLRPRRPQKFQGERT